MMGTTLDHDEATVYIEPGGGGRSIVSVVPRPSVFVTARVWETRYPLELIEHILRVKGAANLCSEIRRDEDPLEVEHCLRWGVFSYVRPTDFAGKRVLDFGCGCGASTSVLARLLPEYTEIVGVDLSRDYIELARHRVRTLGIDERVGLHVSTDPTRLPDGIGRFDYILMSAVYEHLLPDERVALLPQLWSVLEPGGVVFLNQTPFRWFPVETHTTRLPLVNYLPDRWTLACARRFSMRVAPDESWEELLRRGIRGGTHKEIVEYLQRDERNARLLDPEFLGVEDRIALWYRMSSERRAPLLKKLLLYGFRFIRATTGQTVVPGLSLAIKKVA